MATQFPISRHSMCALLLAATTGVLANVASASPTGEYRFTVNLDGKPIGDHRFVLQSAGDGGLRLSSEARFDVHWLGIPLYRYRHVAHETWSDGCLTSLDARTEDNGKLTEVRGHAQGERFAIDVRKGERSTHSAAPAQGGNCLMTFAYWNPALVSQTRLLDPASGRVEPVVIGEPGRVPTNLAKPERSVRGVRIGGLPQPIDIWYADDRWVGLDTVVSNGRRLSYRLR